MEKYSCVECGNFLELPLFIFKKGSFSNQTTWMLRNGDIQHLCEHCHNFWYILKKEDIEDYRKQQTKTFW